MPATPGFSAAILAGGRARRLGGVDKSAIRIDGQSLLERQLAVLRALTADIFVVGHAPGAAPLPVPRRVNDRHPGTGALGGLYTALVEAPTERVLVIACDMPFLTADFLQHLATQGAAPGAAEAIVPRDRHGHHPLCASYNRGVAGRLLARLNRGEFRLRDALADLTVEEVGPDTLSAFDHDARLLTNLNAPDDCTACGAVFTRVGA